MAAFGGASFFHLIIADPAQNSLSDHPSFFFSDLPSFFLFHPLNLPSLILSFLLSLMFMVYLV